MRQVKNDSFDFSSVLCLLLLLPLAGIFLIGRALYMTATFAGEFLSEKKAKKKRKKTETLPPQENEVWRGYNTSITDLLDD